MKFSLPILVLLAISCSTPTTQNETPKLPQKEISTPKSFNAYWSRGGAEISSYELEQARYGEIHTGTAVNVFVLEPFSKTKQVKLDDYKNAGDDKVSVMKLNMNKKYITGIYPYSMMMSTFSPLDQSRMLKSSTSSQEWCGHTYLQLNWQNAMYLYSGYSYFESEGDRIGNVPDSYPEDQIWSQIRMDPQNLPVGEVSFLPSTFYLRLRHQEIKPVLGLGALNTVNASAYQEGSHYEYSISYPERVLKIYFGTELPHQIFGWEETYESGFGQTQKLTTKAKLINTIRSKYWGENSNSDRKLRKELGLSMDKQ